uniref:hypothetical protein n=1 Tax=uncultured Tenacibaculum sp. TaxID=174713 RepID=UPI002611C630|nr:hypothetical protein [uncultured Tenacibaculum sp.]
MNETIKLCQKGDEYTRKKQYENALKLYHKSWDSIPKPKLKNPLAKVVLIQIYASNERLGTIEAGVCYLKLAKQAYHGDKDSRVNFLLGKYYLDNKNNPAKAHPYFKIAWIGSEGRAFLEEDSKYLDFLRTYKKTND